MVDRIMGWYREQGLLVHIVIGTVAGLAVVFVLYRLWSLSLAFVKPHTVAQRIAFIQMVVGGLGGVTLVAGLLITLRGQNKNQKTALDQLATAHEELDLTRQGQVTDRFTQAIDQLGKSDDDGNKIEEVRLGGIYALAQIAVDEPDHYHWPIMQVFAAYLRRYASWQNDPFQVIAPAADIQTMLNVIGRRRRYFEAGEDEPLFLQGTDFSNYLFPTRAHLEGAYLAEAHFESAQLSEAQLKKADLRGAHLEGAYLINADLRGADLRGAHLEGALLLGADLREANLAGVCLDATYIPSAKLQEVRNLDPDSLERANGAWDTEVGEIPRPNWWGSLPGSDAPLPLGEISIMVGSKPLHFRSVAEGWYSSLLLPYGINLTPAGVPFAGLGITFFSGMWVCDRHKPKEAFALEPAPKPMDVVAWFDQHPHLTLTTNPQKWENPSGDASGVQFFVEVNANTPENELRMSPEGPSVSLAPTAPRYSSFTLVKEKTNQVVILEGEGEWMGIFIEGPPDEFDKFKLRVDNELLANLYWGMQPDEHHEGD